RLSGAVPRSRNSLNSACASGSLVSSCTRGTRGPVLCWAAAGIVVTTATVATIAKIVRNNILTSPFVDLFAADPGVVDHLVPTPDLGTHARGKILRLGRPHLNPALQEQLDEVGLGERGLHVLRQPRDDGFRRL